MSKTLEKYLIDAAEAGKDQLSDDNPYRDIGFDGEKPRLGWVRSVSFAQIRPALESLGPVLTGKKSFIFVGMGGSINGIKPLLALFGKDNFKYAYSFRCLHYNKCQDKSYLWQKGRGVIKIQRA